MSSSEVSSHGELWRETAAGLLALHTDVECYNGGRAYCFQIVGPVRFGRQRPTGHSAPHRLKGSLSRTGSSRAFCTLDVDAETVQWEPEQKELTCKDGEKITLTVYGESRKTRLPTDADTAALKAKRIREWTIAMQQNLTQVLPENSLRAAHMLCCLCCVVKIFGDICALVQTVNQAGEKKETNGEPEYVCAEPTACAGALQLDSFSNLHSIFDHSQFWRQCSGGGDDIQSHRRRGQPLQPKRGTGPRGFCNDSHFHHGDRLKHVWESCVGIYLRRLESFRPFYCGNMHAHARHTRRQTHAQIHTQRMRAYTCGHASMHAWERQE